MTKKKEKLINEINNSKFVGLDNVFMLLGSKKPFKANGDLSESGEDARRTLVAIVEGLECIGAVRIDKNFEDLLDEIIDGNY